MRSNGIDEMEGDRVDARVPWEEVKVKLNFFLVRIFSDILQVKKTNETNKQKINSCYAYHQGSKPIMLAPTI